MEWRKLSFLFLFIPLLSIGQSVNEGDWQSITQQTRHINEVGMKVLLGWSILNMGTGTAGYFKRTGQERYFHQMNGFWNVVNAGIAIGALTGMETPETYAEAVQSGQNMEKILLLNGGLDLGYIAAGGYLLERGKRKTSDRLRGYGHSLMLQGGFLLVLDGVLFYLNQSQNQALLNMLEKADVSAHGLGITIPF